MASLRTDATTNDGGQSIVKIIKVASCVTGDTVSVPANKLVQVINETTADATSVTYSASTGLATVTVANTPDIALVIWL